jgi:hypothetical protein
MAGSRYFSIISHFVAGSDWFEETPSGRLGTVLKRTGLIGRLEVTLVRIKLVLPASGIVER